MTSCSRICLGFFFLTYGICSVVVLGIGIWLRLYHSNETVLFGEDLIKTTGLWLIIAGIILLLSLILGSMMSCYRSKGLIICFLILMIGTAITLIAVGGFMIYVRSHLTSTLKDEMENILMLYYGFDPSLTTAWDSVQRTSRCCGATGPKIYDSSRWKSEHSVLSPRTTGHVPDSCCKRFKNETYADLEKCHSEIYEIAEPAIYEQGCYESIRPVIDMIFFGSNVFVFVVASLALLVSLAIGITLCRTRGDIV